MKIWTGRINIAKISLLPKTIYRFNSILIKMFITFFTCLGQIILKFEWKHRRPQTAKAILRKRRKIWRAQNQIDQWERIENPETNSYIYCKLIISYLKKVKICKSVSSISNIRKTKELHVKE